MRRSEEELPAFVHMVHTPVRENVVEISLQTHGVLGEEQRMDIKWERHGRAAEFTDAVERLQPPGEPDFDDVLTEGTFVADHVDVTRSDVGHPEVIVSDSCVYGFQLLEQLLGCRPIALRLDCI